MKTLNHLNKMKASQQKISVVTAYNYPSTKQAQQAEIDIILVGDSLGMTVLGYDSTVQATLNDMIRRGKAVKRGASDMFIVVDMPIGTVGSSDKEDLKNALKLYQNTNANAVKVEGAHLTLFIQKATKMGILIVSRLGLTPQSVGVMGYKLQGDIKTAAMQFIKSAKTMETAGVVVLVLETIPNDLAREISQQLAIPVIGMGAGKDTDGRVLVYHDMLNYGVGRRAKFAKQFADFSSGTDGLRQYSEEVKAGTFPSENHIYKKRIMDEVEQHD